MKGELVVLTVAVAVMAAAVAGLSMIDGKKLAGAVLAMSTLIAVFAIVIRSAKDVKGSLGTLIVMTVAIGVLAGAIAFLSTLNPETSLKNVAALSILMLTMAGVMRIISGMNSETKKALGGVLALAALAVPMYLFVQVLKQMSGIENAVTNVLVLGGLMTVMTALLAALSFIGKAGLKAVAGVALLTAMWIPMMVFINIIKRISGIEVATNNVILLASLMTVMTVLLGVLTIIGFGAPFALAGVALLTAMWIPMMVFIDIIKKISGIDIAVDNVMLLMNMMTIMTGLLTQLAIIGPFALIGVAAMAGLEILMVSLGSLVVLMGALSEKIGPLIDSGLPLMIKLAEGIGTVIGSFVSGVLTSATQGLPQVGQNLSDFMTNASGFIEGAKNINQDVVTGVKCLSSAIIALSVSELISGITSLMTLGTTSFTSLGTDLSGFMEEASGFIEGAKNIDQGVLDGAKALAGLIIALTAAEFIDGINSFMSKLAGESSFSSLGTQLTSFASAMVDFSNTITSNGGINSEAIEAATKAGTLLIELEKSLPRSGGWIQSVIGEKDLAKFGASCLAFGGCITAFSKFIVANGGVNESAVEAAVNAGTLMSKLQNSLPKTGGWIQEIAGEQDLINFGLSCVAFGNCITMFSKSVSANGGVNPETIEAAVKAGALMSELQNSLPKTGGWIKTIAGEKDLAAFGASCKAFGEAISSIPSNVSISDESLDSITNMGTVVLELQKVLPKSGGWIKAIAGEKDILSFATSCKSFSEAMNNLSSMTTISEDTITSVQNAGTTLIELQKAIPKSKWWDGKVDLGEFGEKINTFKEALISVSSINVSEDDISSVTNAGTTLIELQKAIPESKWLDGKVDLSEFGKKIKSFGEKLVDYSDTVSEMNPEAVSSSITQARKLASLARSLVDIDMSGAKDFKPEKIGSAMKDYAGKVEDIDPGVVSSSISSAKNLAVLIRSLVDLDTSGISSFQVKSIGDKMKAYSDSVSGIDSGAISSSISAANRLKVLINSLANIDTSGVGPFKSAIESLGKIQIGNIVSVFNGATAQLTNVGSNLITAIANGMRSKQAVLTGTTSSMTNILVSQLRSTTSTYSSIGATLMSNLANGMRSRQTTVIGISSSTITVLVNQLRSNASVFNSAGVALMTNLASGILSRRGTVINSAMSVLASAVSSVNGYYGSFYSAGGYLADGFANGISANSYKAAAQARAMALTAKKAAEEALGIESPSKVFYAVGEYTVQGFVNALTDHESEVYSIGYDMAEYARKGLSDAISQIQNVANSDTDYQPTIKPVLDLSDVESGAAAISKLFSGNESVGVSANVDSISSTMNQKNQNGSNKEVVSAIDGLRKDIKNIKSVTYSVNNVTYDDGSNVSKAVTDLVRAARIERSI